MPSKELATEGFTVTFTPNGAWIPGVPNYTLIPAEKLKASGQKVLLTQIVFNFSPTSPTPCAFPPNTFVAGAGNIPATSVKVKSAGQFVMRKGDQGACVGAFTAPGGAPVPCSCSAEITNAGQTKARGN